MGQREATKICGILLLNFFQRLNIMSVRNEMSFRNRFHRKHIIYSFINLYEAVPQIIIKIYKK